MSSTPPEPTPPEPTHRRSVPGSDADAETHAVRTTPGPSTATAGAARSGINLSASQVAGGSLAAATAALLGSKLGTTGTIVGAALVSVITAVGGALYTASLRRTREVVVRTRELLPDGQWKTIALPHARGRADDAPEPDAIVETETAEVEDDRPLWRRINWKPVAIVAAVVFVVAAALVTGAQLATGHDTTVVHVVRGGDRPTPTPSETPTAPTSSPADDTSGSAQPSSSPSATASGTATAEPSESPSASASASPTRSPSASATPSATPTP